MARRSDGESVLHKHLRVLDAFDALHPFLTLTQIAQATGLAASTTHRIVAELTKEGLLERMPDREYRLGVRLWEYASRTPGAVGLREIARPWLAGVHQRVRQHTQLGVRAGTDVLFIERMSAHGAVVNATLIGGRIPLHASASGIVLLTGAPDETIAQAAQPPMRRYTEHTIQDLRSLREAVRRARADGFSVTEGHIHLESRGIAVPVRGPDGSVYAALGVVVPNDHTSPMTIVEVLRVAADAVARTLADAYRPDVAHDGRWVAGVSRRSWDYISALEPGAGRTDSVSG